MLLLLLKILITGFFCFFFYCKATVVGRFSPSKGAQPVEPDIPEPDHPQSASTPQRHETPTVEKANSPSISCGQTPSTVGPPAAQNSNDQSASPFNVSFNSISPSSPWFPQSRSSRQPRSHVSRHLFANMPVYSYDLPPKLWSFLQLPDRCSGRLAVCETSPCPSAHQTAEPRVSRVGRVC